MDDSSWNRSSVVLSIFCMVLVFALPFKLGYSILFYSSTVRERSLDPWMWSNTNFHQMGHWKNNESEPKKCMNLS